MDDYPRGIGTSWTPFFGTSVSGKMQRNHKALIGALVAAVFTGGPRLAPGLGASEASAAPTNAIVAVQPLVDQPAPNQKGPAQADSPPPDSPPTASPRGDSVETFTLHDLTAGLQSMNLDPVTYSVKILHRFAEKG
ncbi:MAG: hypothetical protein ACI91O_001194 [Candidatus Poriferisodalaceae bacterium]|jgi:hypothetical protein